MPDPQSGKGRRKYPPSPKVLPNTKTPKEPAVLFTQEDSVRSSGKGEQLASSKEFTGYQIDEATAAKQLIERFDPVSPPLARQARVQGTVVLKVVIGKDALVKHVEVAKGHPMLAPAAVDAVKKWRYHPFLEDGKAVPVYTSATIDFSPPKQ